MDTLIEKTERFRLTRMLSSYRQTNTNITVKVQNHPFVKLLTISFEETGDNTVSFKFTPNEARKFANMIYAVANETQDEWAGLNTKLKMAIKEPSDMSGIAIPDKSNLISKKTPSKKVLDKSKVW